MYRYDVRRISDRELHMQDDIINRYAAQGWELFFVCQNYCYDFYLYFRKKI